MRITIDLDKRRPNGKPTVHVTPKDSSLGDVARSGLQLDLIENGTTYKLGRLQPYVRPIIQHSFSRVERARW